MLLPSDGINERGHLFDRIGKRKSYTENDARDLCRKMLESLRYCHENSVAHCDMKPKNLLLVSDDDDVQMKLADFGFATRVYEPSSLTKQCETPFFVGEFGTILLLFCINSLIKSQ